MHLKYILLVAETGGKQVIFFSMRTLDFKPLTITPAISVRALEHRSSNAKLLNDVRHESLCGGKNETPGVSVLFGI